MLHHATLESRANEPRTFNHRFKFAEGEAAREILHTAVGRDREALWRNVLQRGLDARGYDPRRFDIAIGKIEQAG